MFYSLNSSEQGVTKMNFNVCLNGEIWDVKKYDRQTSNCNNNKVFTFHEIGEYQFKEAHLWQISANFYFECCSKPQL